MALQIAKQVIYGFLTSLGTEEAKKIFCMVLEEMAKLTETKVDDEIVKMLKKAWGIE